MQLFLTGLARSLVIYACLFVFPVLTLVLAAAGMAVLAITVVYLLFGALRKDKPTA